MPDRTLTRKKGANPLNAVELSDVSKAFGRHTAVDGLSLQVPEGSLYGFIGPNGSGKTTTIRMILHIIHPDCGRIEVLGQVGTRAANDSIGYLPEERGLYKKMTVRRVLGYYASLKGMPAGQAHREIEHWMARFDLSDWLGRKVEQLSKGMAQKVQLIASVVARPRLVILDEPFTGLDPVNLEVLRGAILDLRNAGTTVIFSTHDMAMAERMCDAIFMIFKGEKVLDGTVDSIKATYGADTIRLRLGQAAPSLTAVEGVERVVDMGHYQEVQYRGDPQRLLEWLVTRTCVRHFEVTQPSLHDIFIRIAGPEANHG